MEHELVVLKIWRADDGTTIIDHRYAGPAWAGRLGNPVETVLKDGKYKHQHFDGKSRWVVYDIMTLEEVKIMVARINYWTPDSVEAKLRKKGYVSKPKKIRRPPHPAKVVITTNDGEVVLNSRSEAERKAAISDIKKHVRAAKKRIKYNQAIIKEQRAALGSLV